MRQLGCGCLQKGLISQVLSRPRGYRDVWTYSDHLVEVSHLRVGEASSGPTGADEGKRMAGSGALVLQLGLYNLGSTFSLFSIWVSPPYLSSPWVLLSLRPSLCLYPSAPGTAPLTLSNHVVTESGALGGISDLVPTPTSLPVSQADLAN